MRSFARAALCVAIASAVPSATAKEAPEDEPTAFEPVAAWDEFEVLLRSKYAYIERDDIDVAAQLERSGRLAVSARNEADLRRILHRTALTFMDPHLIVGPFEDDDYAILMSAADLDARFIEGRALVTDVRRGSPAFEAGIRPGHTIVTIDGAPPRLAARLPFGAVLPDPTSGQLDYGLMLATNGKRVGQRNLTIAAVGEPPRDIALVSTRDYARSVSDRPLVTVNFVGIQGDIAVLTPQNSLGNNATIVAFDAAIEQARGARAVILDMRETPSGGNTEVARSIIGHFLTEPKPYQMHRIPALEREFTVPRQFVEYALPREPHFAGSVFVLHGKWTGSMGEGIVIGMDAATQAVTIGSDMGDLLGALWNFELKKSNGRVDLGGESLFHVDGTPREDYVADHPMDASSTAPDGSDPALAKALQLIEKRAYANQSR